MLNKKSELLSRIEEHKPQIIGITESLPKNAHTQPLSTEYEIKTYDMFSNKNPKRGVLLYIDKTLNARECETLNNIEYDESVWCTYIDADENNVIVGCIYRSPNSTQENNTGLLDLMKNPEISKYDKVCIMGDFNYPEARWDDVSKQNNASSLFIDSTRDALLVQKVNKPTRHRENQKSSMIDLVFVNDESIISDIEHECPVGLSDHEVLIFDLYTPRVKSKREIIYNYIMNKGDFNKIGEDVSSIDCKALITKSVGEIWDTIHNCLTVSMEKNIPKRPQADKKVDPPWFSNKVKRLIRKKKQHYNRFLQTNTGKLYASKPESREALKENPEYKSYKRKVNKCNKQIKAARRKHEMNIANNAKSDPKVFWKYVKERTKSSVGVNALKKMDNTFATSEKEKADILNEYFSSVFTIENTDDIPDITDNIHSDGKAILDLVITPAAVEDKLKKLDASKAQGPDGIPARIYKELSKELSVPLAILFNKSIENNTLPDDWKIANVTAIFKNKGNKSDPGNYRPVSLTSIACKVLESFIRDAVVDHMNVNNLYAHCQHGFRNKRSCTTQLIEVMEELTQMIDEGNPIDIVYLDFRKAFDSVPHKRLLKKLKAYGIQGNIHRWIEDFLSNRLQRVRVGSSYSKQAKVSSGIPQGSILGPVLFTIFINDLPNDIISPCKIFADDTKIYNSADNKDIIQEDLESLQDWTDRWNLYFNTSKCKVMHLGKNNPKNEYHMQKDGDKYILTDCDEEKDLGVTFDKDLNFNRHIQACTSKANQMIGVIRRTFINIDKDIFTKLYKAIVRPHLEYGNLAWHPLFKYQSIEIEKVQRRATRLVRSCKNLNYDDRLNHLKIHSLKGRRIRGDLIETYKIYNNLEGINWNDLFTTNDSNTRNSEGKIFVKRYKTNIRKNCFTNRVAQYWNNLPTNLKKAQSINSFKNQLDASEKYSKLFREFDE